MKEPIMNRIERWYEYASVTGVKLTRILVHPEDYSAAPNSYKGLPVEFLGQEKNLAQ